MGNYLTHTEITELHLESLPIFEEAWKRGKRNERYKQGMHWTPSEADTIRDQYRHPYSISLMNHKINNIISTQRQSRTSIKVSAPDEYSMHAEVATGILRGKERTEDLPRIESDVFESGLSVCYGATEVVAVASGGEIRAAVKKRDYLDVLWDGSARDYNLADALFIAVGETFRRESVERKYGKITSYGHPLFAHSFYRDENGSSLRGGKDTVRLVSHYTKTACKEYLLLFNDHRGIAGLKNGVYGGKHSSRHEAEKTLREFTSLYLERDLDPPMSEVIPVESERVTKYLLTGGEIVDIIELPLAAFPVAVYRPFQFENRFWSLADLLVEPQIFLDRVFMQIDYSLGRDVKNVYQGNAYALAENETPETALKKAERTGGIIWTRTGEEVFRPLKVSGVNPQYFQLAAVMQGFIEDLAGGRSFHGLADYSNESGRAIMAKQKQGMLAAGLVLDNLRRWKCSLGEKLLEATLQYEGEEAVKAAARLAEREAGEGGGLPTAEDLIMMDREIVVTEAPLSNDEKAEKLEQLVTLNNIYPGSVPVEVMLNYMNLDRAEREEIINNHYKTEDGK